MLLNGGVFRGPSSVCYMWLRSRVSSLIRVLIPGAVLTDGRATTQVCDPRFLVAAIWEAGFRWLVSILGEDHQTAVQPSSLTGAAGNEAPIVVLWGVDHAEVIAVGPCCGALIKDGCSLGDAPASLLLLQLSYFLRQQIVIMRGKTFISTCWILPYHSVGGQLLLQLLCLFFDGAQVILYRLPRMHPPVEAVVQPSPKPAGKTEISNAQSWSFDDNDDDYLYQEKKRNSIFNIFKPVLAVITYLKQWGAVDGRSSPCAWLCPGRYRGFK